jgi:hypothetical protein
MDLLTNFGLDGGGILLRRGRGAHWLLPAVIIARLREHFRGAC